MLWYSQLFLKFKLSDHERTDSTKCSCSKRSLWAGTYRSSNLFHFNCHGFLDGRTRIPESYSLAGFYGFWGVQTSGSIKLTRSVWSDWFFEFPCLIRFTTSTKSIYFGLVLLFTLKIESLFGCNQYPKEMVPPPESSWKVLKLWLILTYINNFLMNMT